MKYVRKIGAHDVQDSRCVARDGTVFEKVSSGENARDDDLIYYIDGTEAPKDVFDARFAEAMKQEEQ
jgi:hypothetical protein